MKLPYLFSVVLLLFKLQTLSSISTRYNPSNFGFVAELIPPRSPHSPFYNILKDNSSLIPKIFYYKHKHKQVQEAILHGYQIPNLYTMEIYLGFPPVKQIGVFDTGSHFTWFLCLPYKEEIDSNMPRPSYDPSKSSFSRNVSCSNAELCNKDISLLSQCSDNSSASCEYVVSYMSGQRSEGMVLVDYLSLKYNGSTEHTEFAFGCTNHDTTSYPGIIGLGDHPLALHYQLSSDPDRPLTFSFCISPSNQIHSLVRFGYYAELMGKFTTLLDHPSDKPYIYVHVDGIMVDNEKLDLAEGVFTRSPDDEGGFTIDSGCTTTYLTFAAHKVLRKHLETYVSSYATRHGGLGGFDICFAFVREQRLPESITILIRGAPFKITREEAWIKINDDYRCLLIKRTLDKMSTLGNPFMKNVNFGIDRYNNMLYVQKTDCDVVNSSV